MLALYSMGQDFQCYLLMSACCLSENDECFCRCVTVVEVDDDWEVSEVR